MNGKLIGMKELSIFPNDSLGIHWKWTKISKSTNTAWLFSFKKYLGRSTTINSKDGTKNSKSVEIEDNRRLVEKNKEIFTIQSGCFATMWGLSAEVLSIGWNSTSIYKELSNWQCGPINKANHWNKTIKPTIISHLKWSDFWIPITIPFFSRYKQSQTFFSIQCALCT